MSFFIQKQNNNTYIVYGVDPADEMDTISLGMITNNKIPGFAPVTFAQMDDTRYIKYNITALRPISQFQGETLCIEQLLALLCSITDALLNADEYMIDLNHIILDPNYLFVNDTFDKVALICWPIVSSGWTDPEVFFRKLIQAMPVERRQDDRCLPQIMEYVSGVKHFSLSAFKKKLYALSHSGHASEKNQYLNYQGSSVDYPVRPQPQNCSQEHPNPEQKESDAKSMSLLYLLRNFSSENMAIYSQQQKEKKQQGQSIATPAKNSKISDMGFEVPGAAAPMASQREAVHWGASQSESVQPKNLPLPDSEMIPMPAFWGRELLDDSSTNGRPSSDGQWHKPTPHLIRIKNQEKILITKPEFRLGKRQNVVDYCISDNPKVSRLHATITSKNGVCYIADAESLNHTYVGGEELMGIEEVKLTHGAKVSLADEEFEFREY